MTIFYFGERWDAPVLDVPDDGSPPPVPCPTPVGEPCVMCQAPIVEGERGLIYAVVDGSTPHGGKTQAGHIECEMLHTIGHVHGVCTCTGWDINSVEARREIITRINHERMTHHMGPLW